MENFIKLAKLKPLFRTGDIHEGFILRRCAMVGFHRLSHKFIMIEMQQYYNTCIDTLQYWKTVQQYSNKLKGMTVS